MPRTERAFRPALGLAAGEARTPVRAFFERLTWEPLPKLASVRVDDFFAWLEPGEPNAP